MVFIVFQRFYHNNDSNYKNIFMQLEHNILQYWPAGRISLVGIDFLFAYLASPSVAPVTAAGATTAPLCGEDTTTVG